MISGTLAKRYARALIGLSGSPMQRDRYLKDLETLAKASRTAVDGGTLASMLDAGHLSPTQRLGIGRALCQKAGADATVTKFMSLLVERGRVGGLVLIARHYRDLADEASGRVRAKVVSSSVLTSDAINKIKAAIAKATGKQVMLETAVDPALIGGLVTTVGSYTLDGSVRSSIARLRTTMHASN